jgi:tetratricopeptide (TPR) repeat protein
VSPQFDKAALSQYYARLFGVFLTEIDAAVASLHLQEAPNVADKIGAWASAWRNALDGGFDIEGAGLLRYGLLLGQLAEAHSFYSVAEDVLDKLADRAVQRVPWIPDPTSVLITAGEYNRRRGYLDKGERRYNDAKAILTDDPTRTGLQEQAIHKELGRVFYEIAYLHRLRGDAEAARSALQRSETECDIARDPVGAEIARTELAAISYEEGLEDATISILMESVSRFNDLATDLDTEKAGRSTLARRWVINAKAHLAQTYIAKGNYEAAKRLIAESEQLNPSITGMATLKRIEAQAHLAQGNLALALDVIGASWTAISQQPRGDLASTELGAATVAIAGIIHALEESVPSALSCFEQACSLPADLHNRRPQAWAWAGRAILAKRGGDTRTCQAAVQEGLLLVERCGWPVRRLLLTLLKNVHSNDGPDLNDLKNLVCRSG